MDLLINAVILVGIVAGAIFLFRPRPSFVIQVRDGKATVKKGKVSAKFLRECDQLCAAEKIQSAKIWAYTLRGHTALRFSSQVPPEHHQKFRNVWSLHR